MTLVSGNIHARFVPIFEGVPKDSAVNENIDFHGFSTVCLQHVKK